MGRAIGSVKTFSLRVYQCSALGVVMKQENASGYRRLDAQQRLDATKLFAGGGRTFKESEMLRPLASDNVDRPFGMPFNEPCDISAAIGG